MEDLSYLKTEYNSIVLEKDELIKVLNLVSKVSHTNSSSIECSCLTFIPDWERKTLVLATTNDLTYFRANVELLGENSNALRDVFSIKIDTLNKIKQFFRNKVLIYKKESEFYIRLLDGDLLIHTAVPNMQRLTFTTSIKELIYENNVEDFTNILSIYSNMTDEYSDKWLSFDTEKLSLCGTTFYAETKLNTPLMCLLMTDVDLIIKLSQYYASSTLQIFSTDSVNYIPRLQLKVANIEIEILNVVSSLNKSTINTLTAFVEEPMYIIETDAVKRVINIALNLIDIEKDLRIKVSDKGIVIILKSSKGDSEFNLNTQKLKESSKKEVVLSVNTLNKIIGSINSEKIGICLGKVYTSISSENTRAIILNK